MNVETRYPILPPREVGTWPAFVLAAAVHVLLGVFLFYGLGWQSSTPASTEAELWASVPDMPTPRPSPTPTPQTSPESANIALQAQHRKQQAQLEAELARERKRQQQEQRQAVERAQWQRVDDERRARLAQMQAMAGKSFNANREALATTGTGAGSGGTASSSYADKVRRRVQPNIVFSGNADLNISTQVAIDCAPDGHVLSLRVVRPSGNPDWDDAAVRAVRKSDPMPLDDNGTAPAYFLITFRPRAE